MLSAFEFLKDPKRAEVKPVVAAVGDDLYLRREVIRAVARRVLEVEGDDLEIARFPGASAALADVIDEVRTLPFLAKARVAVVEDADPFVTAHRKGLEAYAENPTGAGVLILALKSLPSNTKLAKLVAKTGLAIECKTPSEREMPAHLVGVAKSRHGLKLREEAARLLVELVGADVGLLASELEKLACYVGEQKEAGAEDVAKIVGGGRVETIWAILDAATTGESGKALGELDRLLASGEPPIKLLAGVSASLSKLHHAGMLRSGRVEAREACKRAGIPPFAVEKAIRQHGHLGPDRVSAIPDTLLKADLDLKGTSQLPPRTILERLIVGLARPRRDGLR